MADIVYGCFGMIKPQRPQRALRKRRERWIIPIPIRGFFMGGGGFI